MSKFLVIAEKPSVAQSYAKNLSAYKREDGYLEGESCIVSWCLGHLAEYAQPEEYDPKYEKWQFDDLPILPEAWNQVSMVTDVYSHILDDDRKKNAELFEEAFYEKKNLDPQMHPNTAQNTVAVPEGVDAELLAKVLNNPEMAALLTSLAKTMK